MVLTYTQIRSAALFPRRWAALSSEKGHPCAWLAGGSEYQRSAAAGSAATGRQHASNEPTGPCDEDEVDIAAAAAAGVGHLTGTRRTSILGLARSISFSRRRASGYAGEDTNAGLEAHFLRLVGVACLADIHPECKLTLFRPGEPVFVRDDVGDAQPFAFVARGVGPVIAPGGDVLDVVRPGSFFGSTQVSRRSMFIRCSMATTF
jgi:hypothetical protein